MIESFDDFLRHLDIPDACSLDKPLFKKLFMENGVLDAADKSCLKDDVSKIRWLYTLKPSTINIAPYNDDVREYPEIAILHIESNSQNRQPRIANFINRSIPYPLILLFTCNTDLAFSLSISLADKRTNQADKEKWVLEDTVHSKWITLAEQSKPEVEFLSSLDIKEFPFTDFWNFYQAIMDRVVALNCASHSGDFKFNKQDSSAQLSGRLEGLREIEKLNSQKTELANKLKKEKQMGKQVELNTKIKKINNRIADIQSNL